MEFAVGNLMQRLFGWGPPSTQLVRFIVTTAEKTVVSYPVLLSTTVEGVPFDPEAHSDHLNSFALSQLLVGQLLTLPGDARAPNFIYQGNHLICIDNDVSFVEPILIRLGRLLKTVQFTSILFALKHEISLDSAALEAFCEWDPWIVLNG